MNNRRKGRRSGPTNQKLFTAVKSGWSFSAVPNGAEGWRALALASLPLLLVLVPFTLLVSQPKYARYETEFTIGFLAVTIFWTAWFMRWVYQNSDIVDMHGKRRD
jgi:hypothetical protein